MNIMDRLKQKIIREYNKRYRYPALVKGKKKIFCIGLNKTGTTSLKKTFKDLDFIVGNQRRAAKLLDDYIDGNFESIIQYCTSAQVFQDSPFSFPETFKYLDMAYPNSKFILAIRNSPEQWYNSLVKFHSKFYGEGKVPTADDLKNTKRYVKEGRPWKVNQRVFKSPKDDPYNKKSLIKFYIDYNAAVKEYFNDRPEDLIVINVSKKNDYQNLMSFLDIDSPFSNFPWENKTATMKSK